MAEAIHCPSCTTRYRLRPERVSPAIRRAKCLSCGDLFPVEDAVQRLLGLPVEAAAATASFKLEDIDLAQHAPEPEPEPVPEPGAAPEPPSLTLGDLDTADADLLERTLAAAPIDLPEAPAPEPPAPLPPPSGGYTSARDAIDKLFGGEPVAPAGLKVQPTSRDMDMEATLSALESTLGGQPATATAGDSGQDHGDLPTDGGLSAADLAGSSTSTVKISHADLLKAMAAMPAPAEEPTVALRASDLAMGHDERTEVLPPPAPAPAAVEATRPLSFPPAGPGEAGAELLRLKIGEDIYPGLTMAQLIAWVEEGRILENHLIARQHSENWLEAHKVPGLRPVFDRVRRTRLGADAPMELPPSEIAPKKSLFGGLFGKS